MPDVAAHLMVTPNEPPEGTEGVGVDEAKRAEMPPPPPWLDRNVRDGLLFALGFAGAFFEIFFDFGPERPTVIILIAACLGLPFLLRANGH